MSLRFFVDTRDRCLEVRAALAAAEGLPRRSIVVGCPDQLPPNYAPGAAGWTDQVCPEPVDDGTQAALEVPAEAVKHLGKTVRVGARNVTIPAAATRVLEADLPAGIRAKRRPADLP